MSKKLRVLDLFAGIGGFSLGFKRAGGFKTVAFCEIEKEPQRVLAKHWPEVPIYDDVTELTAARLTADGITPDVITGGFPCQDISCAGGLAGMGEGTRSGLWSECARLVGEVRPKYAVFENSTNLLIGPSEQRGAWFSRVLCDLAALGYDAEWHRISAANVGAGHIRDRVWILAYPMRVGQQEPQNTLAAACNSEWHVEALELEGGAVTSPIIPSSEIFPDAKCLGQSQSWWPERPVCQKSHQKGKANRSEYDSGRWVEPNVGRVIDGLSSKLDMHRLKMLGNTVMPQITEKIGRYILEAESAP